MREKMENALSIEVDGADMTTAAKLEFYVRQGCQFLQYEPQVLDEEHLMVKIPYADAKLLRPGWAKVQLALTDADGNRRATDVISVTIGELIKEAGYD